MINLNLPFNVVMRAKPQTFLLCSIFAFVAVITFILLSIPDETYEEFIFGKDDDI